MVLDTAARFGSALNPEAALCVQFVPAIMRSYTQPRCSDGPEYLGRVRAPLWSCAALHAALNAAHHSCQCLGYY